MLAGCLVAVAVYLIGWFVAARCFAGIQGPVPAPGRWRRDVRDGLFWPAWLVLYGFFWLIGQRKQAFENELTGD